MQIYKIAQINIGIETNSNFVEEYLKDYLSSDSESCDFYIKTTQADIEYERSIQDNPNERFLELSSILRKVCTKMTSDYNGFIFHCSALEVDGKAYLFAAPSLTGKSTHARLWREVFGEKVKMINDDKPIIRIIDNKVYAYGTPWNGKHRLSRNVKVPVKAVCFLSQGKDNKINKINGSNLIAKILNQTMRPCNTSDLNKLFDLIEIFISSVSFYKMECNISHEAAVMAYEEMRK